MERLKIGSYIRTLTMLLIVFLSLHSFSMTTDKTIAVACSEAFHFSTLSEREKVDVQKTIDQLDGTTSVVQFDRLARKLHGMTQQTPNWWNQLRNRERPTPIKNQLQKKFEQELFKRSLITALAKEFKEPNQIEKIKIWRLKNKNLEKVILATTLNYFMYSLSSAVLPGDSQLSSFVPMFPALDLTRTLEQDNDLLKRVSEEGFETVYPEIRQRRHRTELISYVWSKTVLIYTVLSLAVITPSFFDAGSQLFNLVSQKTVSSEQRAEYQDAHFNPDQIRFEQFESWKKSFEIINGRPPDPKRYPEDRREWDDEWKTLVETPDEDLKANY